MNMIILRISKLFFAKLKYDNIPCGSISVDIGDTRGIQLFYFVIHIFYAGSDIHSEWGSRCILKIPELHQNHRYRRD